MQCPYCGFGITDERTPVCPNCGRYLATTPASSGGPMQGTGSMPMAPMAPDVNPPTPQGEQSNQSSQSNQPNQPNAPYPTYPTYPGYGQPYGQPGAPSQGFPGGYPPSYGPYGQAAPPSQGYPGYPPGYGQAAGPSQGFPSGYGQPGAPSQGFPNYPYGYPSAYSQPMPGMPGAPAVPQKKSGGAGVVISIILAVVVVLALLTAGGLALLHSQSGTFTTSIGNLTPGTGASPTATATTNPNVIFQDSLTSNTNGWADDAGKCFFQGGSYHTEGYICLAPLTTPVDDATVSAQVKQVGGPSDYPYGIVIRYTYTSTSNFYDFVITSDGHWASFLHKNGKISFLHSYTSNSAIHQGLNITNNLKVVMRGSTSQFFANGTLVGQITDTSFASGNVGVSSSGPTNGTPVNAAFNNFEVVQNS